MKKRELEKFIQDDVRKHTPNVLHRIDFDSIKIEKKEKISWFRKPLMSMKTQWAVLSIAILLVVTIVSLDKFIPDTQDPPLPNPIAYSEKEEVYTLSALSAISLLNQVEANGDDISLLALFSPNLSFEDIGPPILFDNYLNQLNRNLNMIEPLIGNTDSMAFQLFDSDLPEYDYKMIFTTTDMRGRTIDYTMYYSETEIDEQTFEFVGIMMIEGTTYYLEGELTVEEQGFKLEIVAQHPNNEDTYVEIQQEVSEDEHTLKYEVVQNGDTIYQSEISIELDGKNVIIEMTFESETKEISFKVERQTVNGQYIYYIEYDIEDGDLEEDGEIIIDIIYHETEKVYYYRYRIETDDQQVIRFKKRIGIVD